MSFKLNELFTETEKLQDQQDMTCFLFICLIGRIDIYTNLNLNLVKELKCEFMASEIYFLIGIS